MFSIVPCGTNFCWRISQPLRSWLISNAPSEQRKFDKNFYRIKVELNKASYASVQVFSDYDSSDCYNRLGDCHPQFYSGALDISGQSMRK
jgi:hypothetical protein